MFQLNVTEVVIIKTTSTDLLRIRTGLPQAVWPYKGEAWIGMEVAKGKGEEYTKQNFPGVPFTIIEGE